MTTDGDRSKSPSPTDGAVGTDQRGLDGHPRAEAVTSRADGRPPTESGSDDPEAQARVILEESEERLAAGAARADAETDR